MTAELGQVREAAAGALVRAARDGDAEAWAALVARHSGLLWSIARSAGLTEADAADVVQTTWLRLVEQLDRIRDGEAVTAWLAVTARRESARVRRSRPSALDAAQAVDPAPGPDQVAEARDRLGLVATALRAMPERCRSLLRLLAFADDPPTYAATAALLGVPVGSIGPTRARCLATLRARLAAPGTSAAARPRDGDRSGGGTAHGVGR